MILSVKILGRRFSPTFSPSPTPGTRKVLHTTLQENKQKTRAPKYLKYLRSFLPVAGFPYVGLSSVHMLSLLTTARLTKELLGKL